MTKCALEEVSAKRKIIHLLHTTPIFTLKNSRPTGPIERSPRTPRWPFEMIWSIKTKEAEISKPYVKSGMKFYNALVKTR